MAVHTSELTLSRLSELVAAHTGLHFPRERWRELASGVRAAATDFGFRDAEACAEWLVAGPLSTAQIQTLASYLTVGETYFFRDEAPFEALERQVLRELIADRRESSRVLRIWSAGCCTGEEPYSAAILLARLLPDFPDWDLRIYATDINPRFLRKAEAGVFGEWSFRRVPPSIRRDCFRQAGHGQFEILPKYKRMVTFSYANLAQDGFWAMPGGPMSIDLILCRNTIMYFTPEVTTRVIGNFRHALRDDGWLIVGQSEASQRLFSEFDAVNFSGVTFYRKGKTARKAGVQILDNSSRLAIETPVPLGSSLFGLQSGLDSLWKADARTAGDAPIHLSSPLAFTKAEIVSESTCAVPNDYEDALASYECGAYAEARENAMAALARGSCEVRLKGLLARICANQGDLAEGLSWCDQAIQGDKVNPAYHYLRATILQEEDRLEEAAAALHSVLYLDPTYVLAHFTLGNVAWRLGRKPDAARHWKNTLSLLSAHGAHGTIPDSEGMTAGRLTETVQSLLQQEGFA